LVQPFLSVLAALSDLFICFFLGFRSFLSAESLAGKTTGCGAAVLDVSDGHGGLDGIGGPSGSHACAQLFVLEGC